MLFLTCRPGHASIVDGEHVVEGLADGTGGGREAVADGGDDVDVARPQFVHRGGRRRGACPRTLGAREREAPRHHHLLLILRNTSGQEDNMIAPRAEAKNERGTKQRSRDTK
jgi:hypothetical protein